jgi:sugar diacid utilization regulator
MYITSNVQCFLLVESQENMSAQAFSLEQVCKERAGKNSFKYSLRDTDPQQKAVTREAAGMGETRHRLHEVLRHLVMATTLSLSLQNILQTLAVLLRQALGVDLCIVLLQERDELRVVASTTDLSDKGVNIQPVQVSEALWKQMRSSLQRGQMPRLSDYELEQLNPLQNVQYQTLLPIPLLAGNTCLGLLLCYSSKTWRSRGDDELLLSTIATQTALAIQHQQFVDESQLEQQSLIRAFVHELCEGGRESEEHVRRRAYFLGYNLTKPHAVALIEFSDMEEEGENKETPPIEERLAFYEDLSGQVRRLLLEHYPGSLIEERNDLLVCLLSLDGEQSAEQVYAWCRNLVIRMRQEQRVHLYIGLGNPCQTLPEYQRGFAEARESLDVGRDIYNDGGCSHFNTLGAYRYLHAFAHNDKLPDQYQEQIETVAAYDQRKRTNLLDTLEVYLECGGNIAKTSTQLDVHRNTLLQRLDRIQKLSILNLENLHVRFPLLVALKVHRLRTHHLR